MLHVKPNSRRLNSLSATIASLPGSSPDAVPRASPAKPGGVWQAQNSHSSPAQDPASSWFLGFRFVCFQWLSHHWQIHSTKDAVGFVSQLASKVQLPSFRKCKQNYKSNFSRRAKELEWRKIRTGRLFLLNQQKILSGFFLYMVYPLNPTWFQLSVEISFLSLQACPEWHMLPRSRKSMSPGIKHLL